VAALGYGHPIDIATRETVQDRQAIGLEIGRVVGFSSHRGTFMVTSDDWSDKMAMI
jgi:hypothetical protein